MAQEPIRENPRAKPVRKKNWQPPNLLPDPGYSPDWKYRWVATSVMGEEVPTNVSVRMREGWTPVKPEEVPEIMSQLNAGAASESTKGAVKIGGLMLCKMPREDAEEQERYYTDLAAKQQESVDNNYMRENNPRMPLTRPERRSQITFGRGPRGDKPIEDAS